MPAPDLDRLAAEARELHLDALDAARVADLCRLAAGQRLLEVRSSMDARAFSAWLTGGACPVLPATAWAMIAAAEQHAAQERVVEPV